MLREREKSGFKPRGKISKCLKLSPITKFFTDAKVAIHFIGKRVVSSPEGNWQICKGIQKGKKQKSRHRYSSQQFQTLPICDAMSGTEKYSAT